MFRKRALQITALLLAVVITIILARLPVPWEKFKTYGYGGIFLTTLLADATVLIPFPGLAAVFLSGSFLNSFLVGAFGGLGSALGELTGYLAGFGGQAVIEDRKFYPRVEKWLRRNGFLTIFFLSLIPNPLFDLAGLTAGTLKFPLPRFVLACFLGKSIKFSLIALAGAGSINFIKPWIGL